MSEIFKILSYFNMQYFKKHIFHIDFNSKQKKDDLFEKKEKINKFFKFVLIKTKKRLYNWHDRRSKLSKIIIFFSEIV